LEDERQIVRMFQFSSTVALHGFRAASHWMCGNDDLATAELHRTIELAEELAHPPSIAFALAFNQYTLMYQRNWADLEATSLRLESLAHEEGFQMWTPQARIFKGFCQAANGDLTGAIVRIRENFDLYQATGTVLTLQQLLPRFGELLIEAGQTREADERLSAMIDWTERRAERAYLPELYRVRGEARRATGKQAAALADLEAAVRIAAEQGAHRLLVRARESSEAA
jgi:tetratricopeptide (TPR) repeat protein